MHSLSVSIRQTVRDFRLACSEWEDDVQSLFNDVDHLLDTGAVTSMAAAVSEDVVDLKGLVEQQTEVLTALVNALTGQAAATDTASDSDERTSFQSVSEVDPFERLQQVVAAASGAS